ncbi:MAG: nitroreductase family protein [Nitrosopumilaceae archaeon]|uniref:Nitroreductase family protein n=1 Tax=Candidatus Nitrosomaritimum aestuariumsis TaxID=3342354 RepID=A0AC60W114_9ARCH|nr:nitroreductase family protein [Nitrosopumilaceae archaeon]NCF22324.1 nitroreductase family protein [Nitrosopumilaceae archaeon]
MDTFDAIKTRRAIKKFDPSHKMSPEEIKFLMELAILAPTSYNQQNWRFITATDQDVKDKISKAARDQAQPKDGSLVIVLCGDTNAWKTNPNRYWRNAPKERQAQVTKALEKKYSGSSENRRDEVMKSCGFAAQTIMLAAKQMGLDSCPMRGFDYDELAKVINLPQDHIIAMMVVVGKALEPAGPRGGQLALDEVVFENKFS